MELHYVYYAIQKDGTPKVGATTDPKRRTYQRKYIETIVLEVWDCPWKAGNREWELQELYFGKRDSKIHYAINVMNFRKAAKQNKGKKRPKEVVAKFTGRPKGQNEMYYGELNNAAKLTEEKVRFIRKHYFNKQNRWIDVPKGKLSSKQLAEMFNVGRTAITKVVTGLRWKHIK